MGDNMGNYSEGWKNKDIDFRVSEESEEVLVKDWIPSPYGVEECSVKISVCKKYSNSCSENRDS
jgi:hypothetical protein